MASMRTLEFASGLREKFDQMSSNERYKFSSGGHIRKTKAESGIVFSEKNRSQDRAFWGIFLTLISCSILFFCVFLNSLFPAGEIVFLIAGISIILASTSLTFFSIFGSIFLLECLLNGLAPSQLCLKSHSLLLGQRIGLKFSQKLRFARKTKSSGQLILRLACFERTTKTIRKSSDESEVIRNTHLIWSSQGIVYEFPVGIAEIEFESELEIPSNKPPSFKGKSNQIQWLISVEYASKNLTRKQFFNYPIFVEASILNDQAVAGR